jgi:peptidyl-prolyl cis-trans isomerase NIMA-interacting 1
LRGGAGRGSLRAHMTRPARIALLSAVALAALAGCTTLSTSPAWIGGGLSVEAPVRVAAKEAEEERERQRIARQPTQVGARHILIMHNESTSKPESITRTKAEGRARAQEALLKIRGGANFEEMVKQYTDEPGGAERSGDLGVFDRSTMVKPFADAAFALKVGEVSEVVETKYGYHIIKRIE